MLKAIQNYSEKLHEEAWPTMRLEVENFLDIGRFLVLK
jgi:hypothetical protein